MHVLVPITTEIAYGYARPLERKQLNNALLGTDITFDKPVLQDRYYFFGATPTEDDPLVLLSAIQTVELSNHRFTTIVCQTLGEGADELLSMLTDYEPLNFKTKKRPATHILPPEGMGRLQLHQCLEESVKRNEDILARDPAIAARVGLAPRIRAFLNVEFEGLTVLAQQPDRVVLPGNSDQLLTARYVICNGESRLGSLDVLQGETLRDAQLAVHGHDPWYFTSVHGMTPEKSRERQLLALVDILRKQFSLKVPLASPLSQALSTECAESPLDFHHAAKEWYTKFWEQHLRSSRDHYF